MFWTYSKLDPKTLNKLQSVEAELGIALVAFNKQDYPVTNLNEKQLKRIEQLEKELGLVLVGSGSNP